MSDMSNMGLVFFHAERIDNMDSIVIDTIYLDGNNNDSFVVYRQFIYGQKTAINAFYTKTNNPYRKTEFNKLGRNGEDLVWYKDGTKQYYARFKDGKLSSPEIMWYPDGSLNSVGKYAPETGGGELLEWYPSQELKRVITPVGDSGFVVEEYYEDGQLYELATYNNGPGLYTTYWGNGNKAVEGSIFSSSMYPIGQWKQWHKDGTLKREYSYKLPNTVQGSGVRDGLWKEWNEKGELVIEETYENGKLTDSKNYLIKEENNR